MKLPPPGSPSCGGSRRNSQRSTDDVSNSLTTKDTKVHKGNRYIGTFVYLRSFVVQWCCLYFFWLMFTEACVFSQLMLMVQLLPIGASAMVKFSTGDGVGETFMSTRANSSASYL